MHGPLNVKFKKAEWFLLVTKYYSNDEVKKDEMTEHVTSMRDKRLANTVMIEMEYFKDLGVDVRLC
jgi:hypothetical protein